MPSPETNYIVISILQNFLGNPKSGNSKNKSQWEFNCPTYTCKHDVGKYNLAYHAEKHVFKCWKCEYSGYVYKLVKEHGSSDDLKKLKILIPEYQGKYSSIDIFNKKKPFIDYNVFTCELPKGYVHLLAGQGEIHKLALDYVVNDRKISDKQIDKLNIGYAEWGPRKNRIIIPSYNSIGKINGYEARTFLKNASGSKYFGPDYPKKEDIIFNEYFINWDLPVYLCEGLFDSIRIPNAINMGGKKPSYILINKILQCNARVIICLDSDALKDGIKIYKDMQSLGIDVFFVDLHGNKDISKIYEEIGQQGVAQLLMSVRKIDFLFEFEKSINE